MAQSIQFNLGGGNPSNPFVHPAPPVTVPTGGTATPGGSYQQGMQAGQQMFLQMAGLVQHQHMMDTFNQSVTVQNEVAKAQIEEQREQKERKVHEKSAISTLTKWQVRQMRAGTNHVARGLPNGYEG